MNRFKVLFACSPIMFGCQVGQDFQNQIISDFSGTWTNGVESMCYEESWSWNAKMLFGKGLIRNGSDTLFIESLQIIKKRGNWFYGATIANQNEGKTVYFKLEHPYKGEYVFTNKKHDFPQTISYTFSMDSAFIRIEGMENGEYKCEDLGLMKSVMHVP